MQGALPMVVVGTQLTDPSQRRHKYWVHTTVEGKATRVHYRNMVVKPWESSQVIMCPLVSNQGYTDTYPQK